MQAAKILEIFNRDKWARYATMLALIAAGEAVFLLPFVLIRIFRPTILDVFGINNLQLGLAFSVYGIVAMAAYFLGGPLADRFSSRKLMTLALLTTGSGGVFFALQPSFHLFVILYGFWGITTILLFWAALIRSTREWGGATQQGRAYGILDGGRGLVAALLSSVSVMIFASFLPSDAANASLEERGIALNQIIWFYTGFTGMVAIVVWFLVPDSKIKYDSNIPKTGTIDGIRKVMKFPAIWLHALIVLCAYIGYKGTDDFSLYARDAFGYNDVQAAEIATVSFWIRPVAAMAAGFLSDKIQSSVAIMICFAILGAGSMVIASGYLQPGMYWVIIATIAGTSVGIYALRGIYFALFEEAQVPMALTGTAVGLVSFIGYTPDIFMGPVMGYLIDRSPGSLGHQHVFALVGSFALLGCIASIAFSRIKKKSG